jgi:hypothetical protein
MEENIEKGLKLEANATKVITFKLLDINFINLIYPFHTENFSRKKFFCVTTDVTKHTLS